MRRLLLVALLVAALLPLTPTATAEAACGTAFPRYDRAPVAGAGTLLQDVPIAMSDGAVLRADVTLPAGLRGPFPLALTITGYGKSTGITQLAGSSSSSLLRHGYATMTLDDRGTGTSSGMWESWGERTIADYREVLDWIVDQPWSDGRVGLTGTSYMGITSLLAAALDHPAVKAVFAVVPMADSYRDIAGPGGQGNVAFIPFWLALVTVLGMTSGAPPEVLMDHVIGTSQFQVPMLAEEVVGGTPAYDGPFWRQRSPIDVADRIDVPTFIVGGLDDLFQRGEPMLYEALADHTEARLLLGPWTHTTTGQGLPAGGVPSTDQLLLQWFDQHVMGLDAQAACIPQVTQYVRGHERYESSPTWPVPGLAADRWYLHGTGGLARALPPADGPDRSYLSVPITGACTRSASQWLIGLVPEPCPSDNRLDETLSLTYTSDPFGSEMVINGPIEADLWVTSDKPDAVVSVAVSDVAPDGTSRGLSNGLLIASHRAVDASRSRMLDGQSIQPWHPFTKAASTAVVPGAPMLLPVEIFPTSAAIGKGHRLRITVAPFDVPHASPPLPSGLDSFLGTVTVLSDAAHPSSVVFPVVSKTAAAGTSMAAPLVAATGAATGASTDRATSGAGSGAAIGDARRTAQRLPVTGGDDWSLLALVALAAWFATRRRAHE